MMKASTIIIAAAIAGGMFQSPAVTKVPVSYEINQQQTGNWIQKDTQKKIESALSALSVHSNVCISQGKTHVILNGSISCKPNIPGTDNNNKPSIPEIEKPENNKPNVPETEKPENNKPNIPETEKPENNVSNASYADQVVSLVNEERAKAGLSPLTV